MSKKIFTCYFKIFFILLILTAVYSPVSFSDNITGNTVEDPRITGEAFKGGEPNVVMIFDLSRSMSDAPVGNQAGNWDGMNTFNLCGSQNIGSDTSSTDRDRRTAFNFCSENLSALNQCAYINCTSFDGIRGRSFSNLCTTPEQLAAQEECIIEALPNVNSINDQMPVDFSNQSPDSISLIYDITCGGNSRSSCDTREKINNAAYAMEVAAGFTQCSNIAPSADNPICPSDDSGNENPACQTVNDTNSFRDCMRQEQEILDQFLDRNCNGKPCIGEPQNGTSRIDAALNVIFNLLDADNSFGDINKHSCILQHETTDDEVLSCDDFINAPYNDVSRYVRLENPPPLPSPDTNNLFDAITNDDARILTPRFLPMSYSGRNNGDACKYSNGTQIINENAFRSAVKNDPSDPGENGVSGFPDSSEEALEAVWEFYRRQQGGGSTPLALILGYDNARENENGNVLTTDAIDAFFSNANYADDEFLTCRPQFVIVITDGDDTCSGDCDSNDPPRQCDGGGNASNTNRRSTIQAVSNLRTYFSRIHENSGITSNNPDIGTVKKEVLTFVIGLGINDDKLRRNLNAMALAGGTHTKGIIQHIDPGTGREFGRVNVDPLKNCIDLELAINHKDNKDKSALCGIPDDEFEIFRELGRADGLSINPGGSVLKNCGIGSSNNADTNGECEFNGTEIFDNEYFDTPFLIKDEDILEQNPEREFLDGFAFLVNGQEELSEALEEIFNTIDNFTTTGVAPAAPQSAGNVTLRDRVFLSLTRPLDNERLWQGRLGLYSFVKDPDTPGRRFIVRKPLQGEDYTSDNINIEELSIFTNGRMNNNARQYHWEAGSILAQRNPASRNIFTVSTTSSDLDTSRPGLIRYTGDRIEFNNTNLTPETFGISDNDVFVLDTFPPADCDDNGGPKDCSSDCDGTTINNITESSESDCRDCIQNCYRDQIVNLLSGNTSNIPENDPDDPFPHICSKNGEEVDPETRVPEVFKGFQGKISCCLCRCQ